MFTDGNARPVAETGTGTDDDINNIRQGDSSNPWGTSPVVSITAVRTACRYRACRTLASVVAELASFAEAR